MREPEMTEPQAAVIHNKPKRLPPSFTLNEDDLPAIKDWKVGQTYKIVIEAKQMSSSMDRDLLGTDSVQGDRKMNARFEIVSAEAVDKSASSENFEDFESEFSKKKE